jgi:hypothetical protein
VREGVCDCARVCSGVRVRVLYVYVGFVQLLT